MSTWVTIPCHRPYLEDLQRCIQSVRDNGIDDLHTIVVATCDEPIISREALNSRVIRYRGGEWNMSRWWNLGMDFAATEERGAAHEVLVLNADALLERNCVDQLRTVLRSGGYAITAPDVYGIIPPDEQLLVHHDLVPFRKIHSMPGCCFMVRGELGLRCDTTFPGWYNDDDIEWQARTRGGVAMVSTARIQHEGRGAGAEWSEDGFRAFVEKWGSVPWT